MGSDPEQGLSTQEASRRLTQYGPNELAGRPPVPPWRRFVAQFNSPLIYLLMVAIVISVVAWSLDTAHDKEPVPVDAIVIAAIVLLNAVMGYLQESKAADAVAALQKMTRARSVVLRDGERRDITSSDLVPGDILVLGEGDEVGADGRLVFSSALRISESSLTGESEPVEKEPHVLTGDLPIGDRSNMVFKGTAVTQGVGRAVITSTGMATEMGAIATMLDQTQAEPTPLTREINHLGKVLGVGVIIIAAVVMATAIWMSPTRDTNAIIDALILAVSLAVAAVPEGLAAILTVVLALGVQGMAKRYAIVIDLSSVETLGSASVIASDKTGTLTRNEMTLKEVVTASGRVRLSGIGYAPVGDVELDGDPGSVAFEARRVLAAGSLANNAQLSRNEGVWEIQGDPTEAAFLVAQHKLEGTAERVGGYVRGGEAPFDSDRKLMSVLGRHAAEDLTRVFTKGAPDILLERCVAEQVGETTRELTDARRDELAAVVEELSRKGYRTLGVAWREAESDDLDDFDEAAEHDLVYAGVVAIIDPPREEAAQAIAEAHRAGIKTVMITGDHPVTAARIAADLGITSPGDSASAVTGREIEKLDDAGLQELVRTTSVYARVSPEHKLRIVDALQANQLIVSMTGDGVNDAPALKTADIGVAMGITGTEVTKEAAEMILGDDNYSTIVAAVRQGRVIFDNIKKFIRFLLSSNMGEVATVFLGVVLGSFIGLADPGNPGATVVPLLATQILWINLITDSGPALAMGVDPEIDDVMARRPRGYSDRIIDRHMWARIIAIGAVMGIVNLIIFDLCLPGGLFGGLEALAGPEQQLAVARTTVFTALVFMQLFNALNSRSDYGSAFSHLFTNRWLWGSFALAIVLQVLVVEVPFLQDAFGTAPLDIAHWALAIGAGVAVMAFEEVSKAIRRALARGSRPAA